MLPRPTDTTAQDYKRATADTATFHWLTYWVYSYDCPQDHLLSVKRGHTCSCKYTPCKWSEIDGYPVMFSLTALNYTRNHHFWLFPGLDKRNQIFHVLKLVVIPVYSLPVIHDSIFFIALQAVQQGFHTIPLNKCSESKRLYFPQQPFWTCLLYTSRCV